MPYLKVEPEEAVQILDRLVIKAYRIKIWIENGHDEYQRNAKWTENSRVIESIQEWQKTLSGWFQEAESDLLKTYVSPRESYNFGTLTFAEYTNSDAEYKNLLSDIDAKIAILNKHIDFIFDRFNIKITVQAGRDANIQTGRNAVMEVKNEN